MENACEVFLKGTKNQAILCNGLDLCIAGNRAGFRETIEVPNGGGNFCFGHTGRDGRVNSTYASSSSGQNLEFMCDLNDDNCSLTKAP